MSAPVRLERCPNQDKNEDFDVDFLAPSPPNF
jgi:hypothetical protein